MVQAPNISDAPETVLPTAASPRSAFHPSPTFRRSVSCFGGPRRFTLSAALDCERPLPGTLSLRRLASLSCGAEAIERSAPAVLSCADTHDLSSLLNYAASRGGAGVPPTIPRPRVSAEAFADPNAGRARSRPFTAGDQISEVRRKSSASLAEVTSKFSVS